MNRSGLFNQWSLGKKSLLINFDKPEGIELKRADQKCDVVVDNFATGVMERLGLSYEELKKIKPDLIVASITGYGHTGPQKEYMGYGPAMAPLTGLSAMTGYAGGPPEEIGLSLGDPNGGINAATAICAALAARKRTGQGQYIDVSMWEAMTALVPEGWMEYAMNGAEVPRDGSHDPLMSPHNCSVARERMSGYLLPGHEAVAGAMPSNQASRNLRQTPASAQRKIAKRTRVTWINCLRHGP